MALLIAHRLKLALVATLAAALFGGWLLARDAPLFSIDNVKVSGVRGSSAGAIRSSLEQAARSMTTLHVQVGRLRSAVASFTVVKDIRVQTHFPHGLSIDVVEQLPVAALDVGGHRIPLAANGTVVDGVSAPADVPTLPAGQLPSRRRVTDRDTLTQLAVIAAAPAALRNHVGQIGRGQLGLQVQLRQGPMLYFGDAALLHAKWDAAAKILADPGAHGATYIDVRIPSQPTAEVGDPATSGTGGQGVAGGQPAPGKTTGASATTPAAAGAAGGTASAAASPNPPASAGGGTVSPATGTPSTSTGG